MPVTLQFVQDDHIWDPIVKYVSHGWPTHVDVVMPDGKLLGARVRGGVAIREPNYDNFKRVARITLPATPAQERKFYGFLESQIGQHYDFANVFGFVTNHHKQRDGKWFCSMLALTALNVAQVFLCIPAGNAWEIDPWDLFLICSAFSPVEWHER